MFGANMVSLCLLIMFLRTHHRPFFGGGGSNPIFSHFCPSPNPDFDVSWEKWGKMYKNEEKSIWKETEKVFVLADC